MDALLEHYNAIDYPKDFFGFSNEEGDGCVCAYIDFDIKGMGDTFEEAYEDAQELLTKEIKRRLEKGEPIPMPTPQDSTRHHEALQAYQKKDHYTAFKLWMEEAETFNTQAMVNIATLYAQGLGVVKDMDKAIFWFKKASYFGNASAAFNLGRLYENGLFVPESPKEAIYYYRMAAKREHSGAQYNLALMLEKEDINEGMGWMIRAAYSGNQQAQNLITNASNADLSDESPLNGEFRSLDPEKMEERVQEILAAHIMPALAADGGSVELAGCKMTTEGIVEIMLHYLGSCAGCALGGSTTADMILKTFEREIDRRVRIYLW